MARTPLLLRGVLVILRRSKRKRRQERGDWGAATGVPAASGVNSDSTGVGGGAGAGAWGLFAVDPAESGFWLIAGSDWTHRAAPAPPRQAPAAGRSPGAPPDAQSPVAFPACRRGPAQAAHPPPRMRQRRRLSRGRRLPAWRAPRLRLRGYRRSRPLFRATARDRLRLPEIAPEPRRPLPAGAPTANGRPVPQATARRQPWAQPGTRARSPGSIRRSRGDS